MESILASDSPLHFLPQNLNSKQLMVLDSLRFTIEMADYCFQRLEQELEITSKGTEGKIPSKAFNYAWSFIDHSQRFVKLYKVLNPTENSRVNELGYIEKFRDAIQHVDLNLERTHVKMIDNGRPIFGALKWVASDSEKNEVYTCLWISGIFNIKNIEFKQHRQNGYPKFINEIKLETDTLKKVYENEIDLSKTYSDIKRVLNILDQSLLESFKRNDLEMSDWKSKKDVLLIMKNN